MENALIVFRSWYHSMKNYGKKRYVIVLDTSKSMGNVFENGTTYLQTAKAIATSLIELLGPDDKVSNMKYFGAELSN